MSLRDLGIFNPLGANHPGVGQTCWICAKSLGPETRTSLRPCETPDQTGSYAVECRLVCATCALRGQAIMTDGGQRIVEKIKDGDASPYPVVTTDGLQWEDAEVGIIERAGKGEE